MNKSIEEAALTRREFLYGAAAAAVVASGSPKAFAAPPAPTAPPWSPR